MFKLINRKVYRVIIVLCMLVFLFNFAHGGVMGIGDAEVPLDSNLAIEDTSDAVEIPDSYNTGCVEPKNGFIDISKSNMEYKNVVFLNNGSNGYKLDLKYRNKSLKGKVIFDSVDFGETFVDYNSAGVTDRDIHLVFNNCKFKVVNIVPSDSKVKYEFNNCTFTHFTGSNADFNFCRFGDSYLDGLNPYRNVSVNSCYFCNFVDESNSGAAYHTDGTQIFGKKDNDAINIKYTNCRFEIPQYSSQGARINACFMLQLEYCDGKNITFSDCIINGGGFPIYARAIKNHKVEDVNIKNITVGCMKKYKVFYSDISEGVNIDYNTIKDSSGIYIGSVLRNDERGKTSISVSNDTNQKREFVVCTSTGNRYSFYIDKCPLSSEMDGIDWDDLPFDKLYEIPETCDWIVCYEVERNDDEKVNYRQCRFEKWTDEKVNLSVDIEAGDNCKKVETGSCGTKVEYSFYEDGTLVLEGTGGTKNYNSSISAPWYKYKDEIKKIVVKDDVKDLGNQLFRDCNRIEEIKIESNLTSIGVNTFIRCGHINELTIPDSVKSIGNNCFASTKIDVVYYNGSETAWNRNVSVGSNNKSLNEIVFLEK